MDEIIVSIICTAYNHEKYIRKCLDGFIMQETDFKYEVIINDDASTDKTADIIREYEEKYPEIIKPIFQTENQYSKGVRITSTIILPKARGKYLAFCEGDDYWTDAHKLQKQFDVMEEYPECAICVHKVRMISEDEKSFRGFKPVVPLKTGKLSKDDFAKLLVNTRAPGFMQFQLTSYFCRTCIERKYINEARSFYEKFDVGDLPRLLYFSTQGDAYYIDDEMSNYRLGSVGGWNSRHGEIEKQINHLITEINGIMAFDQLTNHIYSEDVETGILSYQLKMSLLKNEMNPSLYNKYISAIKYYPLRSRIRIFASAYCPSMLKLYYKVTGQG